MKPTLYMLVGVPAAGKSTWVEKFLAFNPNVVYVSSDHYVEKFAEKMGKTYSEVFAEVAPRATRLMMRAVEKASREGKDVVWDQTNTSAKARARKLRVLDHYRAIAVVFPTPPKDVLDSRLANRPGKVIPGHVMRRMISSFEYPAKEEGFDEIWDIN